MRTRCDDVQDAGTRLSDVRQGWRQDDFDTVSIDELAQLASPNVLESEAYFELWRRTHGLVAEIVHRRLNGQDAYHTITAFYCHKLPRVLHHYTPRGDDGRSFEGWLVTVLKNYLNDQWRRNRTRRTRHVSLDDDDLYASTRAEAFAQPPRMETKAEHDHLVFFLREIMDQILEGEDRYIFHARYWEEKPLKLIARELGLTETNVRVRHFRAKQRLKKVCALYREKGLL